ncbi:MAG TPA: hypothetical protein VIJ94_08350 [Caulobacteraceae bacterium]
MGWRSIRNDLIAAAATAGLTAFVAAPGAQAQPTPSSTSLCNLPAYRNTAAYQRYCVGSAPTYPTYVDPHTQRVQRYQAVLSQVRDLIGDLQANAASDEELSMLAGDLDRRLFDAAATARLHQANDQARLDVLTPALDDLERLNSSVYLDYTDRLAPALQQAQSEAAQADGELAQARRTASQIDVLARKFENGAREHKADVEHWLNAVLPPSRALDALQPQYLPTRLDGEPSRRDWVEPGPAAAPAIPAIPDPPEARGTFTQAAAPDLADTLDARVEAAERLAPEARAASKAAQATASQLGYKLDRYREYAGIVGQYLDKASTARDDIDAAQRATGRSRWERDGVEAHISASSRAMFLDAAEQYAWTHFKTDVVVPELKRIVSAAYAGRPPYELDDAFVEAAWDRKSLHLFSMAGMGQTLASARELLRRTQALLDGGEQAAVEAAPLLGMGSPGEARAYADTVFDRLDSHALDEAHAALKVANMPEPYKHFWLQYFVGD